MEDGSPSTQIQAGGEHTLYRTASGLLFSAGACGLHWCRLQALLPSLFGWRRVVLPEPCGLFHASYYHNLAVGARTGRLYSWGCGTFIDGGLDGAIPALGRGPNVQDLGGTPETVALGVGADVIVGISGGAYHSAVLTASGKVLTFGAGQLGQLGREPKTYDASGLPVDPTPGEVRGLPASEVPVGIGAGFYNTFVRCESGRLYCAGENQNRQCGRGPKNLTTLRHVKEVEDVAQVSGGYCHTLVRTFGGAVFSLGCGEDGQRGDGLPEDSPSRLAMSAVTLPRGFKAIDVAAGANHSVILGDNGVAYTFGANDVGQCGIETVGKVSASEDDEEEGGEPLLTPQAVLLPSGTGRVTSVSAGYAHTVLQTISGRVFVFGQNENGQLALGVAAGNALDTGEEPQHRTEPIEASSVPD